MSAYLTIKKKEDSEHIVSLSRTVRIVAYIMNNIQLNTMDEIIKFNRESLQYVFDDIEEDLLSTKETIALTMIKGNYEIFDMKENIQDYEDILIAKGMLHLISEMMTDNDEVLYLTYG